MPGNGSVMPAMIPNTIQTANKEAAFFEALAKLGNVYAACRATGMNRQQVYKKKESDPEFLQKFKDAEAANLADFEMELKRRAVDGIQDPVFYRDKIVGYRRKCSDNLMMFSLSALHPEKYRQKFDVTGSVQHNHKAELPEAVLSILDSLKAVNVTPQPEALECSTWNNKEVKQIEGVMTSQGSEEQIDHGQGDFAGWKVRKVEAQQQGDRATVKVHRYAVE